MEFFQKSANRWLFNVALIWHGLQIKTSLIYGTFETLMYFLKTSPLFNKGLHCNPVQGRSGSKQGYPCPVTKTESPTWNQDSLYFGNRILLCSHFYPVIIAGILLSLQWILLLLQWSCFRHGKWVCIVWDPRWRSRRFSRFISTYEIMIDNIIWN